MFTRRGFLQAIGLTALGSFSFGGYAFGVEPMRLRVQRYSLSPPSWPEALNLKIAALADIHACKPWMSVERIEHIVDVTNSLDADLVVLLGDYCAGHRWVTDWVHSSDWAAALSGLRAPLGVHAVLGNHDWWEDRTAQKNGGGPVFGRLALEHVGIRVYENDVTKIEKDGQRSGSQASAINSRCCRANSGDARLGKALTTSRRRLRRSMTLRPSCFWRMSRTFSHACPSASA